jgi:predicted secreted Zn-dependent protease
MHKLLFLCLLIIAKTSSAQVSESLDYLYYTANADSRYSLLSVLNKASPIKINNRTFHGLTKWNVKWNYRWFEQPDGRCKITKVTTKYTSSIQLPELTGADSTQEQAFNTYLTALRTHELGHYDIGKQAADIIDSGIASLPEMSSCKEIETAANGLGYQTLDEYRAKEKQYDADTGHGKTQGAWLGGDDSTTTASAPPKN